MDLSILLAQLLSIGLDAVKGNMEDEKGLHAALEGAKIDSPRGPVAMSKDHNIVQNIYLRKVINGENKVMGIAAEQLADPGKGCKMA